MSVSRRKIGAPPSYVANGQNAGGDFSGLWLGLVGHQPTHQLPFGDGKQENAQGGGGKRLNNHPSSCRRQGTGHVFSGWHFGPKTAFRHQSFTSTHLCCQDNGGGWRVNFHDHFCIFENSSFQIESNSQKGKFTLKYPYHPFRVIYRRAEVRLEDWVYAQILCRPPSSPKKPQQPQFWGVGSQSNRWTLRVNSLENLVLLHPKWTSKVVHWIENLNLYITQKIDLSITSLFHGFQEQGGYLKHIFRNC